GHYCAWRDRNLAQGETRSRQLSPEREHGPAVVKELLVGAGRAERRGNLRPGERAGHLDLKRRPARGASDNPLGHASTLGKFLPPAHLRGYTTECSPLRVSGLPGLVSLFKQPGGRHM